MLSFITKSDYYTINTNPNEYVDILFFKYFIQLENSTTTLPLAWPLDK